MERETWHIMSTVATQNRKNMFPQSAHLVRMAFVVIGWRFEEGMLPDQHHKESLRRLVVAML